MKPGIGRTLVRTLIIITSLLTIAIAPMMHGQVYVSPRGDDSASGAKNAPIRTVEAAIARARSRTHRVVLLPGTYRLDAPINITSEDSGLILESADYAAILSGGVRISGWHADRGFTGRWVAELPAGIPIPRQIYINGVRANRTRGRVPVSLTQTSSGYTATDDTLAHWRNPSALELVYTGGNGVWGEPSVGLGSWTEPRCPVAAINGTTFRMAEPCWTNSTGRVMLPSGQRSANLVGPASVGKQPVYIENAYELLGRPGEFYADPKTREVYYTPRRDENMRLADVEAPAIETLLNVHGTEGSPVHDITVRGITFSYAGWQAPSSPEGFSEIQANYRVTGKDGASKQGLCTLVPGGMCPFASWTPEPGDVRTSFADDVHFLRDRFTHLGAAGLSLSAGVHDSSVIGCIFADISGNGLQLAQVNEPEAPDTRFVINNRIENNFFTNVGAEYRGGIPIVVGYARYTHIAHNFIRNVPYAAISIGWGGWPDKIQMPGVANRSAGNVIEKNRITRLMLTLSDGGGIYTQGRTGKTLAGGELVADNFIDQQIGSGHAIYTDNGSSMVTVRNNVVFATNFDDWGSRHKNWYDGKDGSTFDPLAILNNWWEQGDPDSDAKDVVENGNTLITSPDEAPATVRNVAGLESSFRDIVARAAPIHAPEPPMSVTAFIASNEAYVNWRVPVDDGGTPVTRYHVQASEDNGIDITATEFLRLAYASFALQHPDRPHTFTVTAYNQAGASVPSLPSRQIARPASIPVPGRMSHVHVNVQGARASIHFGKPEANDEDLIGVVVAVDDPSHKHLFTGSRVVSLEGRHVTFYSLDGIPPGKHRFGVAGVNGTGEGEMVWVDGNQSENQQK